MSNNEEIKTAIHDSLHDDRSALSPLQASFEWCARRRFLLTAPACIVAIPVVALFEVFLLNDYAETKVQKFALAINRDAAWARYFNREANKAKIAGLDGQEFEQEADTYRAKVTKKYELTLSL